MPQGGRCARRAASPRTMLRHIRVDGRCCPPGLEYLSREWVEACIGTSSFVLSCGSALTPEASGAKGISGRHGTSRKGKERVRTVQAIEDAHARQGPGAVQVAKSSVPPASTPINQDAGCQCSSWTQGFLSLEHHRRRRGCWPRPSVANIASHCSTHLGHDIERPIRTQGLDLRMTLRHTQYAGRLIFARGACYGTMREDALIHGEPRSCRVAESRQTAGGHNEAAKRQTRGTHRGNDRRLGRGGARIVHSATTTRYRWRTRSVHILPRIRL